MLQVRVLPEEPNISLRTVSTCWLTEWWPPPPQSGATTLVCRVSAKDRKPLATQWAADSDANRACFSNTLFRARRWLTGFRRGRNGLLPPPAPLVDRLPAMSARRLHGTQSKKTTLAQPETN